MKKLYSYNLDCGRMGSIDSLFVAEEIEVKNALGREVYFGEVLGKHSEIFDKLTEDSLTVLSDDQEKIDWLISVVGGYSISGLNPLDYIEHEYDD